MLKWHCILLILSFIAVSTCDQYLLIIWEGHGGPIPPTITVTVGSYLALTCTMEGVDDHHSSVVWGQRTNKLRFENANDLVELAKNGSKELLALEPEYISHDIIAATKNFGPVKLAHRGTYFCMNLKHMLFRIVRIKVREVECHQDQFKCDNGEKCINQHETCDNKFHCTDHSDEKMGLCDGHQCKGSIPCGDHCIPTKWCCDSSTDFDCFITVRNSCCPPLSSVGDYIDQNDDEDPALNYPTHNVFLFAASAFVVIIVCVVIYFGVKECSENREIRNTNNQYGMPMPSIIRTDDNDNSMILNTLVNAGTNNSQEYLDLPPTYDDSTKNTPRSSYHSSLEDIAINPITNDCILPPSYDEVLAKVTSTVPSSSNAPDSSAAFLDVPSVSTQQPPARDSTNSRE